MLTAALLAVSAFSQSQPTRLRGTIPGIDGKTATREGATTEVKLADNLIVALVGPLAISDLAGAAKAADGT